MPTLLLLAGDLRFFALSPALPLLIGSLFFFCVYCNSLGFVFSESISYVFREVRLLKWPVTINNFALGL